MNIEAIVRETEQKLEGTISKQRKSLMLECAEEMKRACENKDYKILEKLANGLHKLNTKFPKKKNEKHKQKNDTQLSGLKVQLILQLTD